MVGRCDVDSEEKHIGDLPLLAIDLILNGLVNDNIQAACELNKSFYQSASHAVQSLAPQLPSDASCLSIISKR
jgi:hypothetical protein